MAKSRSSFEGAEGAFLPAANTISITLFVGLALVRGDGPRVAGSVEIHGCTKVSDSPWFYGKWLHVEKPVSLAKRVPVKGAPGLFAVPDDGRAKLKALQE